jgi:putative hydrolase of the HAD superfamily
MSIEVLNARAIEALPKAVLLDLDNTVYPYEPAHEAALSYVREAMAREFSLPHVDFDTAFTRAREQVKELLGKTASSHSRLLYFKRTLELIGLGSQLQAALNLEQMYWRTFFAHIEIFDGLTEFLDDLRIAGIPLAVITDLTTQVQLKKIVYLGLDHYLDVVVTSEEAGADKPDARLFNIALEKLAVADRPVWFIGDDAVADMEGARAAIGAVTFQKLHQGVVRAGGDGAPDVVFQRYSELASLLRRISSGGASRAA